MRIVRRLGSQFIAFLSGAVLATGLAILTAVLLQDQRPALYGLVFGSAGLVILGGIMAGWVSVVCGDVEALEVHENDSARRDEIWRAERARIGGALALAVVLILAGLVLLPVRLAWKGWSASTPGSACTVGQGAPSSSSSPSCQPAK
jgi:MFS family permease